MNGTQQQSPTKDAVNDVLPGHHAEPPPPEEREVEYKEKI